MLLTTTLVIIGISFPLVTVGAPINCPPGAPCVPIPWREGHSGAVQRSANADPEIVGTDNPSPKRDPGPTFPDSPMHPNDEKRQTKTGTWPYYGYPVQKGPVKIDRSADPEPYPLDDASRSEKRQTESPPTYIYECFHPPCDGNPPAKIERSAVPETDEVERRQTKTGTWPYYGYPVDRPVKIERSADPEPNSLDTAIQPEKRQTNEPPTWPYHPPAEHPERSADSEANQPEKRKPPTGTWPYYGYPVKGSVKIKRSASPVVEDGPHDPEIPHPHYDYNDKRSPDAEAGTPYKKPTGPSGSNGGGPRYLYPENEKRAAATDTDGDEVSTATATATSTSTAVPYYGYRVPEKRSVESEPSEPTETAVPYYGYRVPEKRDEAPQTTASATPYYGYRVPGS
jgi:hypothetical protein